MNNLRTLIVRQVRLHPHVKISENSLFLGHCGLLGVNNRKYSLGTSFDSFTQTQSGIFKTLSESTPVEYTQKFLVAVHDFSGLPWWATIIGTTIILRSCITVPLALYQNYIVAKLENIQVEMGQIATELKKEVGIAVKMYKWDEKTARYQYKRSIKKQYNNLIVRDNCHPFKTTLLFWVQIPMWVSLSISLRNLVYMLPHTNLDAKLTFMELTVGGFGWIPNLTEVDSSLILPIALGLINLAIIEAQALSRTKPTTKLQKYLTNFFRGVSILMVPIAASVPSCLILYWTTSSAFGLAQNLVLMSPKVKRACRIPITASEIDEPYRHLMERVRQKYNFLPKP